MLSMIFAVLTAAAPAQAQTVDTTPYGMCYDSCVVKHMGMEGLELRRCIDECTRLHMPKQLNYKTLNFCETYEEPCDDLFHTLQ